jgi:hypothetical protein
MSHQNLLPLQIAFVKLSPERAGRLCLTGFNYVRLVGKVN